MLDARAIDLHELIWEAAARVGSNAPKIADEIMRHAFPQTLAAAEEEGADRVLRNGLIEFVKGVLRQSPPDVRQHDFAGIDPTYQHLVKPLKSRTYYVESAGEYVSVPSLIADPSLLDDARRYMRKKGLECLAEAERLDALYREVTETAA